MTAAEVVPLKRGGRSFLDEALVGCLDQQHQFLLNGYSLSEAGEFAVEMTGDTRRQTIDVSPIHQPDTRPTPQPSAQDGFQLLTDAIADAINRTTDDKTTDTAFLLTDNF